MLQFANKNKIIDALNSIVTEKSAAKEIVELIESIGSAAETATSNIEAKASIDGSFLKASTVATTADATTDFESVAVGDIIVHIPATAGNAEFAVADTIGTNKLGNAVIGDLYIVVSFIA